MRESSILFWLSLKALVSVEEPVSVEDAPLRCASLSSGGWGEGKHPQMLLVLGRWSLVLFKLGIFKPRIRCHHALFLFAVLHSGIFLLGSNDRYY